MTTEFHAPCRASPSGLNAILLTHQPTASPPSQPAATR